MFAPFFYITDGRVLCHVPVPWQHQENVRNLSLDRERGETIAFHLSYYLMLRLIGKCFARELLLVSNRSADGDGSASA